MLSSAMKLITTPVQFYRDRLTNPLRWGSPVAAIACYGIMLLMSEYASAISVLEVSNHRTLFALTTIAVVFVLFVAAIQAGTIAMLGLVFSYDKNGLRLIEFSALAYWTQVPALAVSIVFWLVVDVIQPVKPATPDIPALIDALTNASRMASDSTIVSTFQVALSYWYLWVVALQATALRVVSNFSIGGAWAAGVAVGSLFVVLPWALS